MSERESPSEQERRAVARIGLSNDGRLLLRKLYRELESTAPALDAELIAHEGRRRLARELIGELEAEHGAEPASGDPRPGVSRHRAPSVPVRAAGSRRRSGVADSEGGYGN